MKLTESMLRKIIREEARKLAEAHWERSGSGRKMSRLIHDWEPERQYPARDLRPEFADMYPAGYRGEVPEEHLEDEEEFGSLTPYDADEPVRGGRLGSTLPRSSGVEWKNAPGMGDYGMDDYLDEARSRRLRRR